VDVVHKVFLLLEQDGPALGLHLNVKKNEIWWPNRASVDPFPSEVDRIDNAGVKLLGAPIGTKGFTMGFVKKKLDSLEAVCGTLRRTGRVCSFPRLFVVQQDQPSAAHVPA
jgi:hypothetical protein